MSEVVQPLTQLQFVPVGTEYTKEQMGNLSLRELQARDIFDPRYTGFDQHFNWRDYVVLNVMHEHLAAPLILSLDQMAQTPEGQHLLRQSLAMQTYRETGKVPEAGELLTPDVQKHRVSIVIGRESEFNKDDGIVTINRNERDKQEYLTANGSYANFTYQDAVYHELLHAADALNSKHNRQILRETHEHPFWLAWEIAFKKLDSPNRSPESIAESVNAALEKKPELEELFLASTIEYPVISATNHFMGAHYDAPPRVLDHGAWRKDVDGGTYLFETIKLPPSVTHTPAEDITPESPTNLPNVKDARLRDL